MVFSALGAALLVSVVGVPLLIPHLRRAGFTGRDMHKPGQPEIPEMGGLALMAGFTAGLLLALGEKSYLRLLPQVEGNVLLATLSTVLLTALIGFLDDRFGLRQSVKAILPLIAAVPLAAIRAGNTWMDIPFIGRVNFWVFYPMVLVPLGVTGAANAVNMLAGFNGLELGMGLVAMGSLAAIASSLGAATSLVLLLAGIGAILGVLPFNWYPAKVFVGDVGTLSMGAIIAAAVIVGNFEAAGIIVIIPYAVDFLFKAIHGFPSRGWWGELGEDGRLRCPKDGPVGLAQAILKLTGGLHERTLALVLMGIEAIFGVLAIALYGRW